MDVSMSVHGVGPKRAKAYHQAHGAGIPHSLAHKHVSRMLRPMKPGETVIPAHIRGKAQRRNSVRLEGFTDEEITTWKLDAEEKGLAWREYCSEVFRQAMTEASVVNRHAA